jgi:glycosyltransferase involved in cell wall biosynthesis
LTKVLFPIGYFYPAENGGPALTIYWLTKELTRKKYDVSVITTKNFITENIESDSWIKSDVGNVIYLKCRHPNYSIKYIGYTLSRIKYFDIIVITSLFSPGSLLFTIISILLNKKIIVSPRGELDFQALIYKSFVKKIILKIYNLLNFSKVTFQVTSNMELIHLKRVISSKFRVVLIPNYIDIPEKITPHPSCRYLLFIGRFHPKKAIDNLLHALLVSRFFMSTDFKLFLAGKFDSGYGRYIYNLALELNITDKVIFLGEVKKDKKESLYANSYVTIVPSHTENFGNVVIESLCQSTPVIASHGTPWEILGEEGIGQWVDNSPASLAAAIDDLIIMDHIIYKEMRQRCRDFVLREYDVRNGVSNWINLFNSLMSNS